MSREQLQIAMFTMHLNEPCFPISNCSTIVNNMYENPLAVVQTLLKAGSDHTPLLVLIAPRVPDKPRNFRMEPAWFQLPNFKSEVLNHWPNRTSPNILSCWQKQCQDLRRFLKGWVLI
jgi:hypothetical protein